MDLDFQEVPDIHFKDEDFHFQEKVDIHIHIQEEVNFHFEVDFKCFEKTVEHLSLK